MASPNTLKLRIPFRPVSVVKTRARKVKRWLDNAEKLPKNCSDRLKRKKKTRYYKAINWLTREGFIKPKTAMADMAKEDRQAVRRFNANLKK